MVIISSTICSKAGKILVARQYTNISRMTLEEYIRTFPKSISANQQHTFVENDYIRYIYLPLETTMYLVLITNKNSNIIEDLETIRLVHKVVLDICTYGVSEATIQKNAFDILLAFDDVISFGYRESVTLNQVQNAMAMESSDEKLHLMLLKARMNEAKEASKKAQLEMKKKAKEPGFKGQTSFSGDSADTSIKKSSEPEVVVNETPKYTAPQKDTKGASTAPKKGLQIVKKKETKTMPADIAKGNAPEEITEMMKEPEADKKKTEYNPLQAPVSIECEEKLVCVMQKDGALSNFEVKGELFLLVRDPTKGNCAVYLQPEANNKVITLKPNPAFNKQKWTEKFALAPKDLKDSFNAGQKINCLKYRYASTNIDDLPFRFNYWFNEGSITCEIEYNGDQTRINALDNVSVSFDFPSSETPSVQNVENGDFEIDKGSSTFRWITTRLDESNSTSNIEIAFSPKTTPDDIFPFIVDFRLDYNYYKLGVKGASLISDDTPIACDFKPTLAVERFNIE